MEDATPRPQRTPRLESIQTLRFAAAFLVMGAHAKLVLQDAELPAAWDPSIMSCGVDVFFVISGFVIAMSAARAASAGAFMLDRVLRVVPLYLLLSAVFAVKKSLDGEEVGAGLLVNSLLFLPFLDTGAYDGTLHPYGWSVAYEMWFYGLLALLLTFVAKTRASLVCAGLLAGGSVAVGIAYDAAWLLPGFLFSPLVWEFAAGCAFYAWREKVAAHARHAWALLPVFAGGIWFTSYLGYPGEVIGRAGMGFARALIWGGFAACVFALFYSAERKVKWPAVLVALGTASYSIYLIQPFVVHAVRGLGVAPGLRVPAFYAVSIVAGWLMYLFLERPLLALCKAWASGRWLPATFWKEAALQRSAA